MGDLLEEFFARPYVAAKVAEGRLPDTWREVVGDAVANLTTDLRLENRILYVRLQSSVVRQELFYQREALRDRINEVSKGAAGQCRHRQVRRDASAEKTVGSVHMPLPTRFFVPGRISIFRANDPFAEVCSGLRIPLPRKSVLPPARRHP